MIVVIMMVLTDLLLRKMVELIITLDIKTVNTTVLELHLAFRDLSEDLFDLMCF